MNLASLVFNFKRVKAVNDNQILLQGILNFARTNDYNGCIGYEFNSGNFYEWSLFRSENVRRIPQTIKIRNKPQADALISFVRNYLDASEEYVGK